MKKKKVLLLISIASVALLSATAAVVFSGKANTARLSADDIPPYNIVFTKADCEIRTEEEDQSHYYLEFSKENGIGGKYDIASNVGESFGNADSLENFDFSDPDSIFTISGSFDWGIQVTFGLIHRATIIPDSSGMNVEINGELQFFNIISDPVREYDNKMNYEWYYSGDKGETVRFISFELTFSC